ncbi:ATP-binding protein [Streptomyces sp. SP18CS02]|uniref:ATP-binding protein n=1 Tax=Streptomyces sp. SP18CS02 TaxID=3002531 RepID=UPI002E776681|nr:ATP-binding protein [Streptomyces sp. SP18CS02]MEE1757009.1 ATP-binding protein [Streptomyces sp. SP18CS02]
MNDELQLPCLRAAFYRRERRSIPAARRFTAAALAEWGLDARADEVLLCVSELATNALVHGVAPGRGFRLHLYRPEGGSLLRVELHDGGDGEEEVRVRKPGTRSESGRGLMLVSALSDAWGVGERNPGKIVWCEFHD